MTDTMERFLTGKGTYVADLALPGTLHLKIVRSRYARALLRSVKGGVTSAELKAWMSAVGEGAEGGMGEVGWPVLARERVNYVGQPIAGVVGRTAAEAEDLMDSVEVEYEPLPAVADPEAALRADPIHPATRSNVMGSGKVGKPFHDPDAPVVIEETLRNERVVPNPLEPRGVVVRWDGRRLTVYASTQSVPSFQEGFAESLHLAKRNVRVVQMDTGGAFGSKGGIYPEYIVAAHVARKNRNRPVRWIETRYEHLQATDQGRGVRARVKLFADRDGKVRALRGDLLIDGGAYSAGMADWAPGWIGMQMTGPYAIPQAQIAGRAVYTNKVPLGPYRGAGRPEAAFFLERSMDFLADEIGMDPVDLRLRNVIDAPWTSPTGLRIPPAKGFLEDAVRELDYRGSAARNTGFSSFVLVPAARDGEAARMAIRDGRVQVWMGGNPHGQGHEVFVRKLVAQELGVPPEVIDLEKSDTDAVSGGVGSWGSRTAIVGGGAVVEAARKLREKVRGAYSPQRLLAGRYDVKVFYKPEGNFNSLGANRVTAEVEETGLVRVVECAAYYDAGEVLYREMLESQVAGGSTQAMGQVLSEGAIYDADGQPLVGTIGDAGLLTSTEMARFVVKTANTRSNAPHGAKGVGESPAIGVPPALVRAIERQVGHRLTHTPLAPEELVAPAGA